MIIDVSGILMRLNNLTLAFMLNEPDIKVRYDTKQLYGKVTATRQIVIYRD